MNSHLSSKQIAHIRELIQAVYHEQATPDEMTELRLWIESSREAAWLYAQYMHLFAGLHWDKMHESTAATSSELRAPAGKSPVLGFLGECFNQGLSFLGKSSVFSILVAVCAPIAMLLLMFALVNESPPSPVAVIARSRDCAGRLDDEPAMLFAGRNLFAQQTLMLEKGLVEIEFIDGASALIEGPAAFEILGPNAGSLTRGRLAAVVPPEARGFAVETPSARVVDLGTEFGVLVDDDGRVEAHVFGGQVEVVVPAESAEVPGETALLVQGEALHIAAADDKAKSSKIVRMPAATERFTRSFATPEPTIVQPEPEPAIVLPEPTIVFAHRGSADPTTQGWRARYQRYGEGLPRDGKPVEGIERVTGPIDADGAAAWRLSPVPPDQWVFYQIKEADGLTRELRAEAKKKGWVLRAHVWMDDKTSRPGKTGLDACRVFYRDGEHTWMLCPQLDGDGNQHEKGTKPGTGPFADTRNRYVQYELR
ncbi:MAG: FecR domain-containing protein, partial [Pirellulaceae bacterium]|nr:FecR domain-containing protein [Pirellulaceae bacterium]